MSGGPLHPLIFISSSKEDAGAAEELRVELERRGARVWGPDKLNRVASTMRGLDEAIRRSDAFIVIASSAAARSTWVLGEVAAALEVLGESERSKVIPVLLGEAGLPDPFRTFQTLHVRGEDWSAVAENLIAPPVPEESERDFVEAVAAELRGGGIEFEREPLAHGLRPDFLVNLSRGRRIVLEVKSWHGPGLVDVTYALNQLNLIVEAVEAHRGYLVVADVRWGPNRPKGVVARSELLSTLREDESESPRELWAGGDHAPPRKIFAAMPFADEYTDTFMVAMRGAAARVGASCDRVDKLDYASDVVVKIMELIEGCDAVIADLSDSAPNVLFELGFARALNKPAIHICSTPLEDLPFDVRNWNTLAYRRGQTFDLIGDLEKRLRAALGL